MWAAGARLALSGQDVHFIARNEHLDAMRKTGLFIESELGTIHLEKPKATDQPATIGTCDLILISVKMWDTTSAIRSSLTHYGAKNNCHFLAKRR